MNPSIEHRPSARSYAALSIGAAIITIVLKFGAYGSIAVAAGQRLLAPQPIEQAGLGLVLALVATAINGGVAWILLRASRRLRSITLRADAHHLLTDVWTSVGVVLGIGLVSVTGWYVLDPIIALLVAANIVWTGTI